LNIQIVYTGSNLFDSVLITVLILLEWILQVHHLFTVRC
ncbi:unnamed protein product, partial [Heterotrigona itama]